MGNGIGSTDTDGRASNPSQRSWGADPTLPRRPLPRRVVVLVFILISAAYVLLWCPYYYPQEDSALYLTLARSLANGNGFTYMGIPYKRVAPAMPWLLAVIVKCGGGIGVMHATLIAILITAHVLCFLALRRLVSDWLALAAVVVTAAQYWVFRNAVLVSTEPLFVAAFWAALLALTYVRDAPNLWKQWAGVLLGLGFLALAFKTRVAAVFLLPGVLTGLWLGTGAVRCRLRLAWVLIFVCVFGFLMWDFSRPAPRGPKAHRTFKKLNRSTEGFTDRFRVRFLKGVDEPIVQMPFIAGRWALEGFASPMRVFFVGPGTFTRTIGKVLSAATFLAMTVGWIVLLARRQWWLAALATYFVPFWFLWTDRVFPRYLIPIMPIFFIMLWAASTSLVRIVGRSRRCIKTADPHRHGPLVAAVLAVLVIAGNLPVYGVEVYVRRRGADIFYTVIRQGFNNELLGICAYLQRHAADDENIYVTRHGLAYHRVLRYLTGRVVRLHDTKPPMSDWSNPEQVAAVMRDAPGRYLILYDPSAPRPKWHWTTAADSASRDFSWWKLYVRDRRDGAFHAVDIPAYPESFVRSIPSSVF